MATEKASEPRIEQRWNAEGDEAVCIIWGDKIIGFGPGADGRKSCEDVLRRGDKLHYYSDCPDYILTKPAAPPADKPTFDPRICEATFFLADMRFTCELKAGHDGRHESLSGTQDVAADKPTDTEVWAMIHEHLPHGVGETTVRQLWPLLVELVERRRS